MHKEMKKMFVMNKKLVKVSHWVLVPHLDGLMQQNSHGGDLQCF